MTGTNAQTGKELTGLAHLRQSVRDILTTPIGTRVMRRDYGSRLHELVDAPLSPELQTDIYAAVTDALGLWEPRLRIERVKVVAAPADSDAHMLIDIIGIYLPTGETVRLEGIEV